MTVYLGHCSPSINLKRSALNSVINEVFSPPHWIFSLFRPSLEIVVQENDSRLQQFLKYSDQHQCHPPPLMLNLTFTELLHTFYVHIKKVFVFLFCIMRHVYLLSPEAKLINISVLDQPNYD